tara:strand:+ start:266 stop:463 length:198 start_codon:yes stop_codon:yes gene_type:complete
MSSKEKWYYVKKGMLYKHVENDGWAFLKNGPQEEDIPMMTIEEALIKCPRRLEEAAFHWQSDWKN